jgi:hypothetical protein
MVNSLGARPIATPSFLALRPSLSLVATARNNPRTRRSIPYNGSKRPGLSKAAAFRKQ